jgi:glycosyltransferase involved in cell wall biosynthesis
MPTGIDRVEYAYARYWLENDPERVTFVMRGPIGSVVAVPHSFVGEFLHALDTRRLGDPYGQDSAKQASRLARSAIARMGLSRGAREVTRVLGASHENVYLLVSHAWADRPGPIEALRRKGVKFVPLVHDLIPATHPEYASPAGAARHHRRIEAFTTLADGIIVNSNATAREILPHLPQGADRPPILAAPLGIDTPLSDPSFPTPAEPYFVCIGTIEPRKNHLLLLNTWRVLAGRLGPKAPKLLLIGRRGWENENILDMLDRCPALVGLVREYGDLPDRGLSRLLQGARALLFPSFAEGYGLPLAEALSLGVPAICSDLPALREVGRDVPEYLDPLDGLGWRRLILSFAEADSRTREAQLQRLERWAPATWENHFALLEPWLRQVARAGRTADVPRVHAGPVTVAPKAMMPAPFVPGS